MSDVTKSPEGTEDSGGADDPIARLIRLAGPRPPAPEERVTRVRDGVHARWRAAVTAERRRSVVLIAAPIAAALVVVLGAGVWLRDRGRVAATPAATVVRTEGRVLLRDGTVAWTDRVLAAGAGLTTGSGGRAALLLSGGRSVRLDTGTELRLVSARVLELERGAVYVETEAPASGDGAAPEAAPIEIRTSLGRVRDVGTQFEVRLEDGMLQVSVREGIATLLRDHRTYTAAAGTRLRVDPHGAVETGTVGLRGADWDWVLAVAPPFDLEGRTLREYLDWLSRETGWTVGYADPSIAADAAIVVLHGSSAGLRPDETPAAVLPTCGLLHRLDGETLIIERFTDAGKSE
jgi:ferric-dicitrate binding protein FerR (iron transport regulator)